MTLLPSDRLPVSPRPAGRPRRSVLSASLALTLAFATAPALAAPTAVVPGAGATPPSTPSADDEAAGRRHYKRGDELFKQGRYLDAAREFEAGYIAAARPVFLINIGHSYRKGGDLRKARVAYEDYLKAEPTSLFRPDVEDLIKSIDDVLSASTLPAAPPSPLAPPPPTSSPTAPALGTSAPVANPPVSSAPITLAPPVMLEVQSAPAPSDEASLWKSPWLWSAVGVVVLASVAGTVYGLNRTPACNATRCLRESD